MKKDIKKLWVDALRSGEYVQGTGVLKKVEDGVAKHCCLGVLCELYNNKVAVIEEEASELSKGEANMSSDDSLLSFANSWDTLPETVQKWAGVEGANPTVTLGQTTSWSGHVIDMYRSLSEVNDEDHYNFEEIADLIEEQL